MAKKYYLETVEFHTNKTWSVLRYFDQTERKRLMKFMASPYFNQSHTMTKLCELLLRLIERGKPGFDRREIWGKLFPGEEYDDVNFRKYCSDLLKLLETFMAQEVLAKDQMRQKVDSLEFIVARKVEPLYSSAFRQLRDEMEGLPYHPSEHYRKQFEVERLYYLMMNYEQKVNVRANIEEMSYNLDVHYWVQKLKLHIAALSQQKTGNISYQLSFVGEIIEYLSKHTVEETPELAIYYYAFLTYHEAENTEHYFRLRRLLDQYGGLMPQKESMDMYDAAMYYCTGKLNQGNNLFLQEYFDLFDDALRKGVFVVNNEIPLWRFNNVVAVALRLGRVDWAEKFVTNNKEYIPAETRENTFSFNLARVYRYQRKFDKVLELLQNVEYEYFGYNLISKVILLVTYYELDAYDTLSSFIESFRVFLNRNKQIPTQPRKAHLNLIKFVRRLTRIPPGDKAAVAKLREEIVREKASTVNHEWLLEKLAEM